LNEYTDLEALNDSDSKRENAFKLYNPSPPTNSKTYRTLICSASKTIERDAWVDAIGTALKVLVLGDYSLFRAYTT
jgi:hypothetical protein